MKSKRSRGVKTAVSLTLKDIEHEMLKIVSMGKKK
jgi:hypothetical protein